MVNRRAKSRITNCDILTRKGPITLKVYREDDTSEIIPEFKASDLHLGEWREVVKACPNKKGKGWTSIYKQIQERIDYLCKTEAELGIDLDKPLSEQDPLDRLNDLANKKRKHADDIHDFFRANKRLKILLPFKTLEIFSNTPCYILYRLFDLTKVQVLRRLGSIFTSVYAAVQKLKKAFEVKQHVSTSVKEIDNVQLGIVNQAELKLLPKAFFSFCTAA
ncbi:hypothetical protein Tco_0682190 [Tanacetum coccineum]|uniref:Transposase n=1 Tax=Tanacetum coccineum TaxID=301880 RepID=A0ABQ4XRC1_9ASTR